MFLGMDFRIFFDRHLCDFVSFYLEGQKNAQKMHQPAEEKKKRKSVEKTVQAEMGPMLRGCQRPKKIKKKKRKSVSICYCLNTRKSEKPRLGKHMMIFDVFF